MYKKTIGRDEEVGWRTEKTNQCFSTSLKHLHQLLKTKYLKSSVISDSIKTLMPVAGYMEAAPSSLSELNN